MREQFKQFLMPKRRKNQATWGWLEKVVAFETNCSVFAFYFPGLKYKLRLDFPAGYPYTAPTVVFTTPCFHPNVDQYGNICLDILKENWSALYEVRTILLSIQSLLAEPNTNSPLNVEASQLWSNQEAYKKILLEKYEKESKKTLS